MPRRTARTFQSRRHNRAWSGVHSVTTTAVAAGAKVLLGSFAPTTSGDVTVLRSVGVISIKSDQAVSTELQQGSFGMIVVTDVALATGITAIPGPVTNMADDGWFLFQSFHQEFTFLTGVGFNNNGMNSMQFDSRAKRIVEDGRSIAIVVENANASHGFDVAFTIRLLSEVYG